ncbi:pyrroline-5-carboxylate reductase [Alicyclobacillaceae bacterium I2511]|jgi:pyrroline-5-carboxylate reductase|nr:pyrroline-5-carboxylate reductase [Alicyclobacillaceae bacterium I2511]
MAEAFIKGVIRREAWPGDGLCVVNRGSGQRLEELQEHYGIVPSQWSVAAAARLVVVAVKPFDMAQALAQLSPWLHGQPVLSFAAGVSLAWMREQIVGKSPVIRTMPNIPVAVLAGAVALTFEAGVPETDRDLVRYLLGRLGEVVEVQEELMDAATAFSGSGPGFVSYFLEAMEEAAVELGFTPEMARELLLQTVVGTALTLREWGISPQELRRRVSSPGGTTEAGVRVLKAGDLSGLVHRALQAAAARSTEMGQSYTPTESP